MIIFVLAYSVAVIAAGLTGNMIIGILGTGVLFSYSAVLGLLKYLMAARFYDTYKVYENRGNFIFDSSIWNFSPLSMIIKFFSSPTNTTMAEAQKFFTYDTSYVGVLLIAAVLYSLVAYLIFMKRASEAAGKPIYSSIAEPVIKTFSKEGPFPLDGQEKLWYSSSVVSRRLLPFPICWCSSVGRAADS